MKLGVAMTVHNRHDVTDQAIVQWKSMVPRDTVFFVVDDASDVPYPGADFRFEQNVGIARAKNKCFELLEDAGVEHAFLVDNDVWPIHRDWWRPYVESPEPHLSYQFLDFVGPVKLHDMVPVYQDKDHSAYSGQRGCVLYYHLPTVLPQVGGFDPIYGRALFEHSDLADRIHSMGLTTWRYADVTESHKLWHSMDEHRQVDRTIRSPELRKLIEENNALWKTRQLSHWTEYIPYRESEGVSNVIITTLLTSNKDPQRGVKWSPDPQILAPWLESVERGGWEGIVLTDELKSLPRGYSQKVVNVNPSSMNVYYQRWIHIYQYLRDTPGIKWVWCTDGSDVEVLRDPFEGMISGKLYVGIEPNFVGSPWMLQNHPSPMLSQFLRTHSSEQLLNAGVVGGDRDVIMKLAHRIITIHDDVKADRFKRKVKIKDDVGDMAAFNMAAYMLFKNRMVYGPSITTDFKAYKDNGIAKFKHK